MELKPCPFCGNPGMFVMKRSRKGIRLHGHMVMCSDADGFDCPTVPITRLCDTKEKAAELWNARTVEVN